MRNKSIVKVQNSLFIFFFFIQSLEKRKRAVFIGWKNTGARPKEDYIYYYVVYTVGNLNFAKTIFCFVDDKTSTLVRLDSKFEKPC